jgi:hypothetical protein
MILPLGSYNVTAYYEGYEPLTKQVTLTKEFSERELNFDFIESTPVESQTTIYIYDIFIFGKVSNVRMGGYTPSYWFHIDQVITIGNQDPKIQLIENREGFMLSMDFYGFVFKNIIIGKASSLLIYD